MREIIWPRYSRRNFRTYIRFPSSFPSFKLSKTEMTENRAQSCNRGGGWPVIPAQRNDIWNKKATGGSSSCFLHQYQTDHLSLFKGSKDTSLQTIDLTNGQKVEF